MIFAMQPSRRCGNHRGLWILLFALPPLQPSLACAAQLGFQAAGQPVFTCVAQRTPAARFSPPPQSIPLWAKSWGWRSLLTSVESLFTSQRRMTQLAMVGMCIGLYILMRR